MYGYVCMYVYICMDESIYDEIMFLLSFIGVFESMYVCMYVCTSTILPMPARPKYMYVHYVCTVCMYVYVYVVT